MPLLVRKLAYAVYELEGFAKVAKLEGLRDVVFFDDVPPIDLLLKYGEILALERGAPLHGKERMFWSQDRTS